MKLSSITFIDKLNTRDWQIRIEYFCFASVLILSPFYPIKSSLQVPLLQPLGLSGYFAILGTVCFIFFSFYNKDRFYDLVPRWVFRWFIILLLVSIPPIIAGTVLLSKHSLHIADDSILSRYSPSLFQFETVGILKQISWLLRWYIFPIIFSIWIYNLFKNDFEKSLRYLTVIIWMLAIGTLLFGILEFLYLSHVNYAGKLIAAFVNTFRAYATPLNWIEQGRLHGFWPEPSLLGLFNAMSLPFMILSLLTLRRQWVKIILFLVLAIWIKYICLSDSRLGIVTLLFELILICGVLIIQRRYKFSVGLILIVILAFNFNITHNNNPANTITTLNNPNAMSNASRYGLIICWLNMAESNWAGVGPGMSQFYAKEYWPQWSNNNEVKRWLRDRIVIPVCGYARNLAELGIVWTMVFWWSVLHIFYMAWRSRKNITREQYFFLIALLGTLLGFMGSECTVYFQYFILLGMGWFFIDQKRRVEVTSGLGTSHAKP